jgi:hypothetical protein
MTQWLVLAGILVTFATAVIGLRQTLVNQRKIGEVHVLVNSQLHAVLDRVAQLTETLTEAGVDVPDPGAGGPAGG